MPGILDYDVAKFSSTFAIKHPDYIIVGAGSAGCVVAARLAADPSNKVLLLEAGGRNRNLITRMPSAFYLPMQSRKHNWGFKSLPEPNLDNRQLDCPRGLGLGGSSAINGMVYVRGHPRDFERWQTLGATGWSYADVLPYFKRAQNAAEIVGPDPYRGHDGPLHTTVGKLDNPLYALFLNAAEQAGYAIEDDLNGANQEAFGPLPMTVYRGERASVARAYLTPAKDNLHIRPVTRVDRILINQGRAVGVEIAGRQILAEKEVIVSAGSIGSPQLLMLSGVGPADHLRCVDIAVHLDQPDVGANLMDHLEVYVQQACTQPVSLYKHLSLFGRGLIGARWLVTKRGLGATNHFETGGFIRSSVDVPYPDIQFHFLPAAMSYDGSSMAGEHGFQAHVGPMLSPSRGHIRLHSKNPTDHPLIKFNYMSHDEDWRVFRQAIRTAREIFAQPVFDPVRGTELNPGTDCQSDEALDRFIRANAESAYHPCGTCRMGTDAKAVVDPEGKVYGIDNLRVVDASIFPHITNGNLNAPTIMVAEKIAAAILRD